jgi:ParB family transcriptional regulator, chromosome partitioning protein
VIPHHKKKNHWHVLAGGRRYRALSVLAKHGSIDSDYSVPLRLYEGNDPQGVSLAENVIRAPMHPADQYSVFAALIRNGQTVEQVAANYGVSETVVKKRMKLGNLAPEILEALRRDEIDTHQAAAYTLADSKEAQLAIFIANPSAQAWMIKRDVTTGEVGSGNKKARFVSVEAYREAGGATRLDMFADRGDTEYLTDAALLEKLFHEKLNGIIEAVRAEGWQNVSYFDGADWQVAERFKGRIYARAASPNLFTSRSSKQRNREKSAFGHSILISRGRTVATINGAVRYQFSSYDKSTQTTNTTIKPNNATR